jgi:hypothetical protein
MDFSITAGLIPRSLLRKELFPDLLESGIPEGFYRVATSLGRIRTFGGNPGKTGTGPPI